MFARYLVLSNRMAKDYRGCNYSPFKLSKTCNGSFTHEVDDQRFYLSAFDEVVPVLYHRVRKLCSSIGICRLLMISCLCYTTQHSKDRFPLQMKIKLLLGMLWSAATPRPSFETMQQPPFAVFNVSHGEDNTLDFT